MKRFDTVIFDLDGTLLDTLEDITYSVNSALAQYGFPSRAMAEIRSFIGSGAARLMELSIPGGLNNQQYEKCLAAFRKHYAEHMQNKTGAYVGIIELLGHLSQQGYKIAIASNKFDKEVKEFAQIYFGEYIKIAIGESENVSRKPSPALVFKALEELGSNAEQSVYVGDTEVDIQTAKNAKMICIGVTWGYRNRMLLEQEGADYVIDKPQELLKILEMC